MKILAVLFAIVLLAAVGLGISPTAKQQTAPVCPATALNESKDCAKASTGCLCSVEGWVTWTSKPNCTGCRLRYNYTWSCTNPASSGSTGTQTSDVGCDTNLTLDIASCQCDGTALISLSGHCGKCPGE